MTSDDDRQMWLLNGFWIQPCASYLHMLTIVIGDFYGPQALHQLQKFIAAATAILPAVAAGDDFFFAPADANAEIDTTLRQPVQRGKFFCGVDRVTLWYQADAGA